MAGLPWIDDRVIDIDRHHNRVYFAESLLIDIVILVINLVVEVWQKYIGFGICLEILARPRNPKIIRHRHLVLDQAPEAERPEASVEKDAKQAESGAGRPFDAHVRSRYC